MASEIDNTTGCPVFHISSAEMDNLALRLQEAPPIVIHQADADYPQPYAAVSTTVLHAIPRNEVPDAVAHVEQAALGGNDPAHQALSAMEDEVSQYFQHRGGAAQIVSVNAFVASVLKQVDHDKPDLVNGMALSWVSHGDSIGGFGGSHCVNWDHLGVKSNQLDGFSKAAAGDGFLSSFMAQRVQAQWKDLNPVGGNYLNLIGLGPTTEVPQQALEAKLAEINTRLQTNQH